VAALSGRRRWRRGRRNRTRSWRLQRSVMSELGGDCHAPGEGGEEEQGGGRKAVEGGASRPVTRG